MVTGYVDGVGLIHTKTQRREGKAGSRAGAVEHVGWTIGGLVLGWLAKEPKRL